MLRIGRAGGREGGERGRQTHAVSRERTSSHGRKQPRPPHTIRGYARSRMKNSRLVKRLEEGLLRGQGVAVVTSDNAGVEQRNTVIK